MAPSSRATERGEDVAQRRHSFFFWNRYTNGFEKKKLWYWMKEARRMVEWEMCAVHEQEDREV